MEQCLMMGLDLNSSYQTNISAMFQNMTSDNETQFRNFLASIPGQESNFTSGSVGKSDLYSNQELEFARAFLRSIVAPSICIFGLVGNLLTLLILSRKRLNSSCDGNERTVNVALIALAVSDFMCCVVLLPHAFYVNEQTNVFTYPRRSLALYYRVYNGALINTFFLTSTWLTVSMATSRYLAICHPFRARHIIGLTGTRNCILGVFVICVLFNVPGFFLLESFVDSMGCADGSTMYFINPHGLTGLRSTLKPVYDWVYFSIGIFLPLAMLAFCNICLVKALRESSKLRKRYRVPAAHVDSNYRITSILVTIVVMYICLVSPAEILRFLQMLVSQDKSGDTWRLGVDITNVLQTLNFACNFVLYFVLNVHFRKALRDMLNAFFCQSNKCKRPQAGEPLRRRGLKSQSSLNAHTTNTYV